MAKIQTKNPKIKPKTSCFTSCFCISIQKEEKSPEIIGSRSRKKIRLLSWTRFQMKKSRTKTVPVDNCLIVEKKNVEEEIKVVETDEVGGNRQIPVNIDRKPCQIPSVVGAVSNQSVKEKPRIAKYVTAQRTNLESRELLHPSISLPNDTWYNRKIDTLNPVGQGRPASPESKSTQATTISKPTASVIGNPRVLRKKPSQKADTLAGQFHPVLGMSILMVILAIMLLWGKIFAIVCTSAWFYVIPYFKPDVKSSHEVVENKSDHSDVVRLDSEEYKKKVILEGLLERNHRNSPRVW